MQANYANLLDGLFLRNCAVVRRSFEIVSAFQLPSDGSPVAASVVTVTAMPSNSSNLNQLMVCERCDVPAKARAGENTRDTWKRKWKFENKIKKNINCICAQTQIERRCTQSFFHSRWLAEFIFIELFLFFSFRVFRVLNRTVVFMWRWEESSQRM